MPRIFAPIIATMLLVHLIDFTIAGNTTCAGNMTQWYTDAVGETACTTYERLRQICNPDYQVPNFRVNTPGDQCDDQLQSCCCNSISWALSMLCMNCQWDVDGGSAYGIDAGVGAYAMYRSPSGPFCTPGTNQSLPTDIQSAVCNKDIKLANFLYDLFWSDGSWYYIYTMNTGSKDEAATNNNMYTHCNSTTSTTTTSITGTTSPTSSSPSSQNTGATPAPSQAATTTSVGSTSNSKIPTIVGAVIGSVVVVGVVVLARFCWRKRQRRRSTRLSSDADNLHASQTAIISPYTVSDSIPGNRGSYGFHKRAHPPMRDNLSSSSPATTALAATVNHNGPDSPDLFGNAGSSAGALRHLDAGAVPTLSRSGSGRLPPAYNPVWRSPSPPSMNTYSEHQE